MKPLEVLELEKWNVPVPYQGSESRMIGEIVVDEACLLGLKTLTSGRRPRFEIRIVRWEEGKKSDHLELKASRQLPLRDCWQTWSRLLRKSQEEAASAARPNPLTN